MIIEYDNKDDFVYKYIEAKDKIIITIIKLNNSK